MFNNTSLSMDCQEMQPVRRMDASVCLRQRRPVYQDYVMNWLSVTSKHGDVTIRVELMEKQITIDCMFVIFIDTEVK